LYVLAYSKQRLRMKYRPPCSQQLLAAITAELESRPDYQP